MNFLNHFVLVILVCAGVCGAQTGNTWQIIDKMPYPVYGGQAVVIDSLIYILGGYSDSLPGPVDLIQVYDPVNHQWKQSRKLPESRYGFILSQFDRNKFLSIGGIWNKAPEISSVEILDFNYSSGNTPEIVSRDPRLNRIFATGHFYKQKYYLIGGLHATFTSDALAFPFVLIYNFIDSKFEGMPDSINQNEYFTYHQTSVLMDTVIYIFGGVQSGVSGQIYALNLLTNRIRPVGRLRGVRAGATSIVHGDSIYIIGGYSESPQAIADVEIYQPFARINKQAPRLNYGRQEPMAVLFGDAIFVFGGKDKTVGVVPAVEKLGLVTKLSQSTEEQPTTYYLLKNYPNPFNTGTTIAFELALPGMVRFEIFSINGTHIDTITGRRYPAGAHKVYWDGTDRNNFSVSSGLYIGVFNYNGQSNSVKMILLR